MKSFGIIIGILLVILVIGAFWMLRGRPAGETLPTLSPATVPVGGTGAFPLASPTASPISGVSTTLASPTSNTASTAVSITATGFGPASVTVPMNGTVTFTNSDTRPHQLASDPHPVHTTYPPLNSSVLVAGQSLTVTFTKAGTFGYHDHLNPGLIGTVIVR